MDVFDCCFGLYNCYFTALSKPCAAIWQRVNDYCARLRTLCYVYMMICVILYALSCVAGQSSIRASMQIKPLLFVCSFVCCRPLDDYPHVYFRCQSSKGRGKGADT